MNLLLDTHVLLRAAGQPDRLPQPIRAMLEDAQNKWVFSMVSLWEIVMKRGLGRKDFQADSRLLRRASCHRYTKIPPITFSSLNRWRRASCF